MMDLNINEELVNCNGKGSYYGNKCNFYDSIFVCAEGQTEAAVEKFYWWAVAKNESAIL